MSALRSSLASARSSLASRRRLTFKAQIVDAGFFCCNLSSFVKQMQLF
jgi:hypothetical protein